MILVDTNVLSETTKRPGDPIVLAWLAAHGAEIRIPTVVLAELRYGCEKLPASRRREELEDWLASLLIRFEQHLLPFDRGAAEAHGRLRARLRLLGKPTNAPDSYIAAMALALNCPIATRNVKDFEWSGADLIDPWQA